MGKTFGNVTTAPCISDTAQAHRWRVIRSACYDFDGTPPHPVNLSDTVPDAIPVTGAVSMPPALNTGSAKYADETVSAPVLLTVAGYVTAVGTPFPETKWNDANQ